MVQIVNSLFADYLEPTGIADPSQTLLTGEQTTTTEPTITPIVQPLTDPTPTYEQQPLTKTLQEGFTKEPLVEQTSTPTMIVDPIDYQDPAATAFDFSTLDLSNLDLSGLDTEALNNLTYQDVTSSLTGVSPAPTSAEGWANLYGQYAQTLGAGMSPNIDIDDRTYAYNYALATQGGMDYQGTPEELRAAVGLPDTFSVYDNPQAGITTESAQGAYQALTSTADPMEALSQYYGIELQAATPNEQSVYTNADKYGTTAENMAEFQSVITPVLQQVIPYIQMTQGLRYDDALEYAYKNDPMVAAIYNKYGVDLFRQTDDGSTYFYDPFSGLEARTVEVKDTSFRDVGLAVSGILFTAGMASGLAPALSSAISGAEAAAAAGGVTTAGSAAASAMSSALTTALKGGSAQDILVSAALAGGIDWLSNTDAVKSVLDSLENQFGFEWNIAGGEDLTLATQPQIDLTELSEMIGNIGGDNSDWVIANLISESVGSAGDVGAEIAQQAGLAGLNIPAVLSGIRDVYKATQTQPTETPTNIFDTIDTTVVPETPDTTTPPTTDTPVTDEVVTEETTAPTAPVVDTTGGMLTGGTTQPVVDTTAPTVDTTQPPADTTAPTQPTTLTQTQQTATDILAHATSGGEYREDYDYNNDGRVTSADALMSLKLNGVSREDLFGYVETIFGSTVDDITASLDSIGDLEEQITTGQEILGAVTDERDALAGQVATLEGQLADAQAAADAAVAAGDANAAELQANADAIQEQLNATTAELDNANATITGLETELGTTQETLAATQEELTATQEERDAAQTKVADLTGLLDTANTDLETKTAEIETLNSTVETLNTDIEVLTGDLDTANNNIADLKEQLQTAKDTGADNVADLESQLKAAQDNAAGIQESLDAKTAELDDANATIETLSGEVETLNTTVEDLNGQLEAKQGELDTANTRVSELETELGTTQETLSTTQEELATTQETLATTEEALQERQDELDTANTTIIDLRNQITDVNSELLSTQSDLTAKQTELDNAIANNLENVGELEAEVADLTSKVDELSAESEDLQDQLQTAQDELDELKQDYSDLSEERDGLLTTIAGLEGDLAASQAATETAIAEGQAAAEAAGEAGYATGYGEGEDVGFNVGYGAGYGEGGSEGSTAGLGLGSLFGLLGGYGAGQQQGQGVGFALGAGGRGLGGAPTQAKDFTAELNFRPPTAERLQQKQLQDYVGMLLGNMR